MDFTLPELDELVGNEAACDAFLKHATLHDAKHHTLMVIARRERWSGTRTVKTVAAVELLMRVLAERREVDRARLATPPILLTITGAIPRPPAPAPAATG